MSRIVVVVEGRTEEEFIKQVIAPYLESKNLCITPIDLRGRITVEKMVHEMSNLYHNFHFHHVTSLVDLYGFRHREGRNKTQLEDIITRRIQKKIGSGFDSRRVTAYVQQYEFEGLLFSSPDSFRILPDVTEEIRDKVQAVRDAPEFNTPEDINDTRETSPGHRLERLIPRYDKVLHGSLIAKETTLEIIREQCPGFNCWLSKIEELSPSKPS